MRKASEEMKASKYDGMSYGEILSEIAKPTFSHGKEARQAHKALRKYHDGLPLYARYPDLPYLMCAFAGGFSAATVAICFLSM